MSNPIAHALEQVAARLGKSLSESAANAVKRLYQDAGAGLRKVVENITKADEEHAGAFLRISERIGAQGTERIAATKADRSADHVILRGELDSALNPGASTHSLSHAEVEGLARTAATRSAELQQSLPEGARGRVTMATAIGQDDNGGLHTVVGTSEPRGYLRPGVTLKPGEELARGDGHAEVSTIAHMQRHGYAPVTVGAGRPICETCQKAITAVRAVPATPLRRRQ